jgi:hypothetical protein
MARRFAVASQTCLPVRSIAHRRSSKKGSGMAKERSVEDLLLLVAGSILPRRFCGYARR